MKQSNLEAFLGRPLTSVEVTNLDLYLKIAEESLETLLCITLCSDNATREFDTRDGYRTVFTDIFTTIDEVKIDDVVIDPSEYSFMQWDNRNGKWFNSIVFKDKRCGSEVVEASGDWGFDNIPSDLQSLWAKLFDQVSVKNNSSGTVKRKRVEDFEIEFRTDVTTDDQFYTDNASVISKYRMCDIFEVISGEVWRGHHSFYRVR